MTLLNIIKCSDVEEAKSQLAILIQRAYDEVEDAEQFSVGLSGGSLPAVLSDVFLKVNTNWKKWKFFFCDERLVSFSDPESTFGAYKKTVMEKIPEISLNQFVTIDPSLKAQDAAYDYISKMRHIFLGRPDADLPSLDLLFLGMGPDGHTCSLFPDHFLLKERKQWVAYIGDSPKPPPERITFTLPIINNAKQCIFYVTGAQKAQILKEIIVENKPLPAGMVRPKRGELHWIVDSEAASLLPNELLRRMSTF